MVRIEGKDTHIIVGKQYNLFYDVNTNSLYKIDKNRNSLEDAIKKSYLKKEYQLPGHKCWCNDHKLDQLTLIVSTGCNLKCQYCYANEGKFHGYDYKIMSPKEASEYIDVLFDNGVTSIKRVMFFGGEPLLALHTIDSVCTKLEEANKSGLIEQIPVFSMITNMTLCDKKAAVVIKKHAIQLTASIDGPQNIHDLQRKYKNGAGTLKDIDSHISYIENNLRAIEATYTIHHVHNNMTVNDLKAFLSVKYQVDKKYISVIPVVGNQDLSVDKIDNTFLEDDSDNVEDGIVLSLFKENLQTDLLCSAGFKIISVTPNGDIYPCHMYTANGNMMLGNMYTFKKEEYQEQLKKLNKNLKTNNHSCNYCWARKFCHICPAKEYIQHPYYEQVNQSLCAKRKLYYEKLLKKAAGIQ